MMHKATWVLLALLALVIVGCVERTETIEVRPDGSTVLKVTLRADSEAELAAGRAPTEAAGWALQRADERDDAGKVTKYVLIATRTVAAGQPLPDSDLAPGHADRALHVQYPTTLKIEQREGAKAYHFSRTYPPRAWAWIRNIEQMHGHTQVEQILKKDRAAVTREEWDTVVDFLATVETRKKLAFARQAYLVITPDQPQDRWLKVHEAGMAAMGDLDRAAVVKLLRNDNGDQAAIEQQAAGFEAKIEQRIAAALKAEAGYSDAQIDRFNTLVSQLRKRHDITSDLQGQFYIIRVKLPGKVVASNATRVENGELIWEFHGAQMFDAPVELMATSVVE